MEFGVAPPPFPPFNLHFFFSHIGIQKLIWPIFSIAFKHNVHIPRPIHPLLYRLSHVKIVSLNTSHKNALTSYGAMIFQIIFASLRSLPH